LRRESAFTGAETCPTWAETGLYEQHITGDVAFAAKLYFAMTNDTEWLRTKGYRLLSQCADFFVSKAEQGRDMSGELHVRHVIPPDEFALGDDSVYTNVVARITLDSATAQEGCALRCLWCT